MKHKWIDQLHRKTVMFPLRLYMVKLAQHLEKLTRQRNVSNWMFFLFIEPIFSRGFGLRAPPIS